MISHGGGLFSSRVCVFPGFTPFAPENFEEMRGLMLHESGFCKLCGKEEPQKAAAQKVAHKH